MKCFLVAAEEENFHRAASRLHIAQPALSRRIRDLESELQVSLFERDRKRVRLSAAGRSYLTDARRVLEQLDASARRARGVAGGQIGTLTLGLRESLVYNPIVARAIHEFVSTYREIGVTLEPELHPVAEAILSGAVDAAFLYSRPDPPRIEHLEIAKETFAVAMPRTHSLAGRRAVRLHDLRNESFLWIRREMAPAVYDRFTEACQGAGFTPNVLHYGGTMTRLQLVSVGMGVTLVHASVDYRVPGVVTKVVADLDIQLTLDLVWRRNKRTPLLDRLIELIVNLKGRGPGRK